MELWIADTDKLKPVMNLETLTALLPENEQAKSRKYVFADDSLRYVTGRILIRSLAALSGGQTDIEISLSEYGKPYFSSDNLPGFSLSHSGSRVVLSFGNIPSGVDVEKRLDINYPEMMSVFNKNEQALINASADPLDCFYRIWTVREAFAKEEGIGLSVFDNNDIRMDYENETVRYQGKNLHFRTITLPEYTISLCAEDVSGLKIRDLTTEMWKNLLSFYPS